MDTSDPLTPSQRIDRIKDSAVSNTGTANNYNIAGNLYLQYPASPKIWEPPLMLPPRAQSFVGRREDIAWLRQQLMVGESGMILAVCGPGGMGKTALAAEALKYLIAEKEWSLRFPDGIFYHSFYTYPSLDIAFEELVRVFGGESSGHLHLAARRAVSHRCALLIFDGVEGLADTRPLRELGGKNVVLILSRRRSDAPDQSHRRDLNVLSQKLAIELLQQLAGPYAADHQSAERLVKHISGYPLALQLIGSYLSAYQQEVRDYLKWFESTGLAAINFGEHQDQSVLVLLRRTYDSLTPDEQHIFLLQGLLAPAPFPLELVQTILELSEQETLQALGMLVNLSVLRHLGQNYEVSHPLIHTFAAEHFSSIKSAPSSSLSETIANWHDQFLNTLIHHFEQSNRYDRIGLALWYPHIFSLVFTDSLTSEQYLKIAQLFNCVGTDAFTQGKYAEAEPLFIRALSIREQQLGADHPDTATSLSNLAALYESQGKYAEAEPLFIRALSISEQQLGADHPDTATSLSNLAALYESQRKYAEAEPLFIRALSIREQRLGADHPSTATGLNNLAALYESQGKYAEAEPLFIRALSIREQRLGADHPSTATSLSNLATLYESQGKYAEAEPLYMRALAIFANILGQNHPSTQTVHENHVFLLQMMERERKRTGQKRFFGLFG